MFDTERKIELLTRALVTVLIEIGVWVLRNDGIIDDATYKSVTVLIGGFFLVAETGTTWFTVLQSKKVEIARAQAEAAAIAKRDSIQPRE